MPVEPGEWERIVAENPDHSRWYIQRFRDLAAAGDDIVGEARLIDAMVPRRSRILDAGCGPGRHAGYLHAAGHTVVGALDESTLRESYSDVVADDVGTVAAAWLELEVTLEELVPAATPAVPVTSVAVHPALAP